MNSFTAIGISQNTSLAVVAPGIAEALFATALGLVAAIPSVLFFNKFNNMLESISNKLDVFSEEIILIISKEILGKLIEKSYKKNKTMSDINVTPFVDVMLVLLIIFMVTAPLLTAGIKVNLPESTSILKNEKNDPVTVTINSKGEIFLQKKKFSSTDLIKKLKALKSENKDLKIYIKGDKKLNYGKVMDLMSFINKSGFKKVALVTKLK